MKTQFYFPAPVEVVKVTNENLADVAKWCEGKVAATESRRVPGRMDSYVWVPTPKGNSISWAFPGMYITRRMVVTVKDEMKCTFQVFRRDYFSRNYFDTVTEAVDKTWEKDDKKKKQKPVITNHPKKEEDDMDKNKHGVPIKDTTPGQNPGAHIDQEMEQAVQNLTEGIPGAHEVTIDEAGIEIKTTMTEEAYNAFAGGQILEGGNIEQVADDAAAEG